MTISSEHESSNLQEFENSLKPTTDYFNFQTMELGEGIDFDKFLLGDNDDRDSNKAREWSKSGTDSSQFKSVARLNSITSAAT
jgi:hypothetical protein